MFKDGVTLNKNAWYVKYLAFLYGIDAVNDFKNFCPLFWFILGSIVITPFILLFKLINKIGGIEICYIKNINQVITIGKSVGWLIHYVFAFIMTYGSVLTAYLLLYIFNEYIINGNFIRAITVTIVIILSLTFTLFFIEYMTKASVELDLTDYSDLTFRRKVYIFPYYIMSNTFKFIFKPFKLLFAFCYSVYKKCCPFINWK